MEPPNIGTPEPSELDDDPSVAESLREFGTCCMGEAGMGRCTCWEPVYSEPQAPPADPFPPPSVRSACCGTCGVVDGLTEELGIETAALVGRPFFCHQGFRRILEYRHPDGRTRPARGEHDYPESQGHYIDAGGYRIPIRADGQPAQLCAAWARWARPHGHTWMDRGEWPPGWRR